MRTKSIKKGEKEANTITLRKEFNNPKKITEKSFKDISFEDICIRGWRFFGGNNGKVVTPYYFAGKNGESFQIKENFKQVKDFSKKFDGETFFELKEIILKSFPEFIFSTLSLTLKSKSGNRYKAKRVRGSLVICSMNNKNIKSLQKTELAELVDDLSFIMNELCYYSPGNGKCGFVCF